MFSSMFSSKGEESASKSVTLADVELSQKGQNGDEDSVRSLKPQPSKLSRRATHLDLRPERMNEVEQHLDERIRTCSLVILAFAVVAGAMYFLKDILIPFNMAVAFKYLLTPLIDTLSCKGAKCPCRLPRPIAVLLSFVVAIGVLSTLAIVLASSLAQFAKQAETYQDRLEQIADRAIEQAEGLVPKRFRGPHIDVNMLKANLENFINEVNPSDIIVDGLSVAAHTAENIMYVGLFLIFMLLGHHGPSDEDEELSGIAKKIDDQIFIYIRGCAAGSRTVHRLAGCFVSRWLAFSGCEPSGWAIATPGHSKSLISALVAIVNGTILYLVGLKLALVFGVLAFFLNFVPNIGMFISVLLPMPLVVLEPSFTPLEMVIAFCGPLFVGMVAKDVLEPWLIGKATQLHPVAVLLCILFFGTLWGIVGMIMAVPLTAIVRIVLSNIEHPLPRYIADILGGTKRRHMPLASTSPTHFAAMM